jgi:hypothetical protein
MWYRIDFRDNDSKFYEIDDTDIGLSIINKDLIKVKRSFAVFPHKGKDGKEGLAAAQIKDMNPMYLVCNAEYINTSFIKSFGVVDTDSNAWKQISENALGENRILTPNKSIVL